MLVELEHDEYGEEVYSVLKGDVAVGGVYLNTSGTTVHFEHYGPDMDHYIAINEHESFSGVSEILTAEQVLEKAIELGWDLTNA